MSAAKLKDVEAIADVHIQARNAYYEGYVPAADLSTEAAELRESYPDLLKREDRTLVCAKRNQDILGIAQFGPPRDPDLDPREIGELYLLHVRPDSWRQGIATTLFNACTASWAEAGIATCVLEVWERNHRARAFYASQGWAPDGYVTPDERGTPYLRLRRPL